MIQYVDNIYCINLDRRVDRWNDCIKEFKKINIENFVTRFSAVEMNPGIAGCTRSHYEVIKLAKARGEKNILILEDDVQFKADIFYDVLLQSFHQMKNYNIYYNLFYLGATLKGQNNILINKNLARLSFAKTTHAYIVHSNVYDYIINAYSNIDWKDRTIWDSSNPNRMNIDVWYINIQKLGHTYGTYPAIADQRKGYSDLIKDVCDYKLTEHYDKTLEKTLVYSLL